MTSVITGSPAPGRSEGRACQAVVGHAIGVVAASGLKLEAARALQVQRDRHFGESGRVLRIRVHLHRGVPGNVTDPVHGRRNRRRATVHLIDVQLDDSAIRQRGHRQVSKDRSAVETRIYLAQCRQRLRGTQSPAQRTLHGLGVEAPTFDTGPCVHAPIVPRSGAPVEMSAQPRNNCAYG